MGFTDPIFPFFSLPFLRLSKAIFIVLVRPSQMDKAAGSLSLRISDELPPWKLDELRRLLMKAFNLC